MPDWDVPLTEVRFTEEEIAAVAAVYRGGWLSQGARVAEFERAFADSVGAAGAAAVSSGTAALHLALVVLGVGAGDEVVLPSLTFAATAATVVQVGATPVFADIVSAQAPWLSAAAAADAVTPRTRAVVAVAYGGAAGELLALESLCAQRRLGLLEDAAHALGAEVAGRAVGTVGAAGAFSFFANKQLPLGEGGMLVCADPDRLQRARRLRAHGLTSGTWERHRRAGGLAGYDVAEPGFNYRLDEPRAALGVRLLARAVEDHSRRQARAAGYDRELAVDGHAVPVITGQATGCGWHIYPILLPEGVDRDAVRAQMAGDGVQTSVHYRPLHQTAAFAPFARSARLPHSEHYAARTLTLPLFAEMSDDQQARVVAALRRAIDHGRRPASPVGRGQRAPRVRLPD
jgi:dTDP-4-amino-4,6-dideoxygalactose transaminase